MQGGTDRSEKIARCCNKLLAFEQFAIGCYDAAIAGLEKEEPPIAAKLREFRDEHSRHVRELEGLVRACAAEPWTMPAASIVFTKPHMEIKKMRGAESILSGMVSNEASAVAEYEEALRFAQAEAPEIADMCTRALDDERRHLAYCRDAYAYLRDVARSEGEGYSTTKWTLPAPETPAERAWGRM